MRKLSMTELNRLTVDEFKTSEKIPIAIILDNIRSLNNIGSVFRTADAFRLSAIFLCGITAVPPHREIHKTALGATESVSWTYYPSSVDAVSNLEAEGYRVIAVEQTDDSIPLAEFHPEPDGKLAFIFGNEVHGIDDNVLEITKECIEIPQYGTKHSINVSVAVGIVIWDVFSKLKFSMNK
ncbi:MAG: RNA methyltransferase [Bacteroidales bacterium]|nr:RNA methyltransferase [Bacteroidales bacterium]